MKFLKRIPVFLSLVLLLISLSACSATKTDLAAVPLFGQTETEEALGAELAVAFSVNAPLNGLEFRLHVTEGDSEITVEIYEANTDLTTTLSEKPLRKETLTDLSDKMMLQFRTLNEGDYVLLFRDAKNATLLKAVLPSEQANRKILGFRNGEPMNDGTLAVTLLLIKTETNPEPGLVTFQYPVPQD